MKHEGALWAVVGKEKKPNEGGFHFHWHVVLVFPRKKEISSPRAFDVMEGWPHANIEGVRSRKGEGKDLAATLLYATKKENEGDQYFLCGDIVEEEFVRLCKGVPKEKVQDRVAKRIRDDPACWEELAKSDEFAGFFLTKVQHIRQYVALFSDPPIPDSNRFHHVSSNIPADQRSAGLSRFLAWCNTQIGLSRRPVRSAQMWLYSEPGAGKTTFLEALESSLRVYRYPRTGRFHCGFKNGAYDLVLLDEFRGAVPIGDLTDWSSGGTMFLDQKGRPGYLKRDNLPFLICANKSIPRVFCRTDNQEGLDALSTRRFLQIHLTVSEVRSLKVVTRGEREVENCDDIWREEGSQDLFLFPAEESEEDSLFFVPPFRPYPQ
jgi:hypothetical protein